MKVKVTNKFHDKADFNKVYLVGETITFDDARAEYLISLGLVELAEEPAKKAEPVEEAVVKPVAKKKSANKDN